MDIFAEPPFKTLAFTTGGINRAAHLRDDEAEMVRLEMHPDAAAYVVTGDQIALDMTGDKPSALMTPRKARAIGANPLPLFLGLRGTQPLFAYGLDPAKAEAMQTRTDIKIEVLRALATSSDVLSSEDLVALAEGKSLLNWHTRHGFCSNCGKATTVRSAGWRRDCPACTTQHFPRTDPVVIMLVIHGDHCLLGRSARFASTMFSCLAGFVEPGETIEQAVRREVEEEAGIICGDVRYISSQPWPYPSSLMMGCAARALTNSIAVDTEELEAAHWFTRDDITKMLNKTHPQGLTAPNPFAIAHHLLRWWLEGGTV